MWILRYAQYDKEFSSLREFAKQKRANSWQSKGKFALNSWIATLALLARNDKKENAFCHFIMTADFCHFERSEKSKEFKKHFEFMDTSLYLV